MRFKAVVSKAITGNFAQDKPPANCLRDTARCCQLAGPATGISRPPEGFGTAVSFGDELDRQPFIFTTHAGAVRKKPRNTGLFLGSFVFVEKPCLHVATWRRCSVQEWTRNEDRLRLQASMRRGTYST